MPFNIKEASFFGVCCSLMSIAISVSSPLGVLGPNPEIDSNADAATVNNTRALLESYTNPSQFYSTPQFLIQNVLAHLVMHVVLIYIAFKIKLKIEMPESVLSPSKNGL